MSHCSSVVPALGLQSDGVTTTAAAAGQRATRAHATSSASLIALAGLCVWLLCREHIFHGFFVDVVRPTARTRVVRHWWPAAIVPSYVLGIGRPPCQHRTSYCGFLGYHV